RKTRPGRPGGQGPAGRGCRAPTTAAQSIVAGAAGGYPRRRPGGACRGACCSKRPWRGGGGGRGGAPHPASVAAVGWFLQQVPSRAPRTGIDPAAAGGLIERRVPGGSEGFAPSARTLRPLSRRRRRRRRGRPPRGGALHLSPPGSGPAIPDRGVGGGPGDRGGDGALPPGFSRAAAGAASRSLLLLPQGPFQPRGGGGDPDATGRRVGRRGPLLVGDRPGAPVRPWPGGANVVRFPESVNAGPEAVCSRPGGEGGALRRCALYWIVTVRKRRLPTFSS